MIDIYEIIKEISAKNRENCKAPDYATFGDIQTEVTRQLKQEINNLIIANKIRHHRTLNSFSFEVLEEQTNNNE